MIERIGEYRVVEVLGEGGQGVTVRAEAPGGGDVAIKLYDARGAELARREAELLARTSSPAVPRLREVFDADIDGERRVAVVQEYVHGVSLQEILDRGQVLSEAQIVGIARELLRIAGSLHAAEPPIVHRDIKPANVIFDPQGHAHLVDFGGGMTVGEAGDVIGTAGYAPPEQYFNEAQPRSDLYAIGATLLHLASRRHPSDFPVRDLRFELEGRLHAGPELTRLITALLEPMPANRPTDAASAEALLDAAPATHSGRVSIERSPHELVIDVRPRRLSFLWLVLFAAVILSVHGDFGDVGVFDLLAIPFHTLFVMWFGPLLRRERLTLTADTWTLRRSVFGLPRTRAGAIAPGFDLRTTASGNHLVDFESILASRFAVGVGQITQRVIRDSIRSFVRSDDGVLFAFEAADSNEAAQNAEGDDQAAEPGTVAVGHGVSDSLD